MEKLTKYSRNLRRDATLGERRLWKLLRNREFAGYKFRRQHKLFHRFIADFYCRQLKLIVEIDGSSHDESRYDADRKRQRFLEDKGLTVLRFSEYEARYQTNQVLESIEVFVCEAFELLTPTLSSKEGEGAVT